MLAGIDVDKKHEFISTYDKTEPKTVFVFKTMTGFDSIELFTKAGQSDSEKMRHILNSSIIEIKNIPEGMTKEVYLERLSSAVIGELVSFNSKINSISEDDEKNS